MTLTKRTFPLLVLSFLWIVFFPVKGVVFQICLYLLPLLVVLSGDTRKLLGEHNRHIVLLSLCFALPLLLSELRAVLLWGGALSDGAFEAFWRLAFFPVVLATVCRYCHCRSRQILVILTAVGVVYGLAGLSGVFFDDVFMPRSFGPRASGFVSNPNPFGFLMSVTSLVSLFLLLSAKHRGEMILALVGVAVSFSAVVVSGSRSAFLGGVVALIVMALLGRRCSVPSFSRTHLFAGLGIVVVVAGVIVVTSQPLDVLNDRIVRATQDIRLTIWSHYLQRFFEHPIMGVPISCSQKIQIHGRSYGPHNMYLSTLVQSGLAGLIALLTGLLWVFRKAFFIGPEKIVVVPMVLLLCCYCFFNSSLFGNEMTQGVFALIVALTLHPGKELS
nr:O-antigen ligase family protein [uncultured Desulfuromonas sp.]